MRRAINYGVNRQTLIDNVLNGYGEVAYSVSDNMPWSSDDMRCEQDISRAKALLDEAGWALRSDGVRMKDGVPAAFDLYYSASDSVRQAIAMEFANQMGELGIKVSPKGASWDDIYRHQFSDPRRVGLGFEQPDRDLQPELLDGQWQLRVLRERGGGRASERCAGQPCDRRFVQRVEACHVGRRERRGSARRCHVGVVCQR